MRQNRTVFNIQRILYAFLSFQHLSLELKIENYSNKPVQLITFNDLSAEFRNDSVANIVGGRPACCPVFAHPKFMSNISLQNESIASSCTIAIVDSEVELISELPLLSSCVSWS